MAQKPESWTIGDVTITSVVEECFDWGPPTFLFPDLTHDLVKSVGWLRPDYANDAGEINGSIQTLVVEVAGRVIVVDTCVGNGRKRFLPQWNDRDVDFLGRFHAAGFDPERVDLVVHTHLHADHVGWDTYKVGDRWEPTFPNARYLYVGAELEWHLGSWDPDRAEVWQDAITPIRDAGLADVVDSDHDLGDGIRLAPSPGHTGGHVSVWIERGDRPILITGDFMHHPLQFALPDQREIADDDVALARTTRRRMIAESASRGALVVGTHFAGPSGGTVIADGLTWRFESLVAPEN